MADEYIIAIELGSSKVTGVAGSRRPDGTFEVAAITSEAASDFMRNGTIFNVDKAVVKLKLIISQLETKLSRTITQVYVGSGGQGHHSIENVVTRTLEETTNISLNIVQDLRNENFAKTTENLSIVDSTPLEYVIGTQKYADPIGVLGNRIEGHFLNIMARPLLHNTIENCMKKTGKNVAQYVCTPIVLGEEVLSSEERRAGCVLVDFGADTTTVSVYKNNFLRFLSVIPLGGDNITKDIESLQIDESNAEQLKYKYGYRENVPAEELSQSLGINEHEEYTVEFVLKVIEARLAEILINVKEQINRSGIPLPMLRAVLIGGGAKLKGIDRAFKQIVGINNIVIKQNILTGVRFSSKSSQRGSVQSNDNSLYLGALSIMTKGTQVCTAPKSEEKQHSQFFTDEDTSGTTTTTTTTTTEKEEIKPVVETQPETPEEEKKPAGPSVIKKGWDAFLRFCDTLTKDSD